MSSSCLICSRSFVRAASLRHLFGAEFVFRHLTHHEFPLEVPGKLSTLEIDREVVGKCNPLSLVEP
jgi:hypothetical protein